jgi:hypothetical protein
MSKPVSASVTKAEKAAEKQRVHAAYAKSEVAFCVGVANVIFSSYLLGAYPAMYFVWHTIKNTLLLAYRIPDFKKRGFHYYLFDYCYLVNYFSLFYFIYSMISQDGWWTDVLRTYGCYIFRALYVHAMGPLALSVAIFRNSMIFHGIDHMTILAVHIGPPLAMFGLRWFYQQHVDFFGRDLFYADLNKEDYFHTLFVIPAACYFLWSIPYAFFMFFIKDEEYFAKRNYRTVYTEYKDNPMLKPVLLACGERCKPLMYMLLHGGLSVASYLFSLIWWRNFEANLILLVVLMATSIYNGSTYYFEVFNVKELNKST